MRQLSGLDASFLYLETANSPMHISSLSIYDPSDLEGGTVRFKQILENVEARVSEVPSMIERLVSVPFQLDHPYWKADGQFDSEFHIRHMALPSPGDWRQLCILISRLHALPLDRSKPLWEMYVIGGLDNIARMPKGCFAVFTKVHHAAVDGHTGTEIASVIHDLAPEIHHPSTPVVFKQENNPSAIELLVKANINNIKQPFRFLSVARNTVPALGKAIAGMRSGRLERVSKIPRTRFNTNVSPHRVFDAEFLDFEDIRAIKNHCQPATVNDVALSIVGGALRKYLQAKNELPDISLAAMAPVNIRADDKLGTGGNQVSQMTVKLCTHIEDPLERLQAVNEGTRNAKELTQAIGAKTMTDYTQFIPSVLTASAARLASSWGMANRVKPVYNCVVTNVPGPQIPLYFTGAKMLASTGAGPAIDGMGLFNAITTYCGVMTISFTCCRVMMPDPAFYSQCIRDSFEELKNAVLDSEQREALREMKTQNKNSEQTDVNKKPVKVKARSKPKAKVKAKAKVKRKAKSKAKSKTPTTATVKSLKKSK